VGHLEWRGGVKADRGEAMGINLSRRR